MKDVSILLPCLNEEYTLEKCIKNIKKVMNNSKYSYEILLCDNNSTDNSINIAKKNKIKYCIEEKKGYGNTLKNGISNANGKYIVMLDCDLSYDENDILKFISFLEQGYELVIGNRFKGKIDKNAMPFIHKIGSKMLSIYSNFLFKNDIKDYHCGLRAFKKDSIINLNLCSQGMEFASEMIIKAKIHHLKSKNINTNYYKDQRNRKSHLRTFRDGFRHLNLINKLKFDNSIIFRYFITFFIAFLILSGLLFLNALIPQKNIYSNTLKSFEYYYKNLKIGFLNNTNLEKEYYRIDYSADIKSLSMAYLIDEKHPFKSIVEMNFYPEIDYGFRDYTKMLKDNHKTESYSRYWQGQTIYLRPLLLLINVKNIYLINIIIFFILFAILLIKLFKINKVLFISFFLATISINMFIVPFCFEYIFPFLIAFIGSIYLLKMIKNNSKNLDILFLLLGIVTCFFDFLTCETITLTLPLFIYIYLKIVNNKKINLKEIIKYCFLWISGYGFMFFTKWIIDCIYFGSDFYKIIFDKAVVRVVDKTKSFLGVIFANYLKIIKCIFPLNKFKYSLTISVAIILLTIYYYIFNISNKRKFIPLILISLIPIVRFFILSSHTNRHYFFVYRAILPMIMLFIILTVNLMLNFLKKFFKSSKKYYIKLKLL